MLEAYYNLITKIFNSSTLNENSNLFDQLKMKITDPLAIIFTLLGGIFIYIYFANQWIYQFIGLIIPSYYLYKLLHFKCSNRAQKIKSMIQYFILYSHIEVITLFFSLIGMYFYHLKIMIVIIILYLIEYRPNWLNILYTRIIRFDKIVFGISSSLTNKLIEEYNRISSLLQNDET